MHGPQLPGSDRLHAVKYRQPGETFRDFANRVASVLADDPRHYHEFREILVEMRFLPAGRVQRAIGAGRHVTAFNCFVSGTIPDSFVTPDNPEQSSIMHRALEAATTMRMGGGIGYDFSTLRPCGDMIRKLRSASTGPLSFMRIFNEICLSTSSSGHRRGAQMGVLRIDHPDIASFVAAKHDNTTLTGFNLSVAVTDEFMEALSTGRPFPLRFGGRTYQEVDPAELWDLVMRSTWDYAEPGVLFIDTINRMNPLWYCETIAATNPCFTGDTLVWTDGGHRRFDELAAAGEPVNVLSQNWDGRLVHQPMSNIRVTQRMAKLVRVRFDNGTEVRCTPNHSFFLRDGGQAEARHLQPGMFVASVYRYRANPKGYLRNSSIVVSVEELDEVEDVYCGTVDEFHRFFVALGDNDGVLVHNCGEQPLPPFGACLLGSFCLPMYVRSGPGGARHFDWDQFEADIPPVVRAMDNVTDASSYPLPQQEAEAKSKRRMGLGVTGLANALEALGLPYGSPGFLAAENEILGRLCRGAYRASALLAAEKGAFPLYDDERHLAGQFVQQLDDETHWMLREHGLRNSHLTSVAPTGTISTCADNVSSSIEPVFALEYDRPINMPTGPEIHRMTDYALRQWGVRGRPSAEVTAQQHVDVLATAQRHVDSAVSKTCNVPSTMPWDDFKNIYRDAWSRGCKGLTTFNAGGRRMALLTAATPAEEETAETAGDACVFDPVTGRRSCE